MDEYNLWNIQHFILSTSFNWKFYLFGQVHFNIELGVKALHLFDRKLNIFSQFIIAQTKNIFRHIEIVNILLLYSLDTMDKRYKWK